MKSIMIKADEADLRAEQEHRRKAVADCEIGIECPCHGRHWDRLETVEFLLGGLATPQGPTFEDAIAELRHALAHPEQVAYIAPEFLQLILDRIDGEATSGNTDLPKSLS